jgi:hypothetical protein
MYRYCRALDRMDRTLMSTVFSPTATVHYPTLRGSWSEFVDYVWVRHAQFEQHSHQLSNVLVWIDAEKQSAVSESYVIATLWRRPEDSSGPAQPTTSNRGIDTETCARYLDRWSKVDGLWVIDHRTCVVDISADGDEYGSIGGGKRNERDSSYLTLGANAATEWR